MRLFFLAVIPTALLASAACGNEFVLNDPNASTTSTATTATTSAGGAGGGATSTSANGGGATSSTGGASSAGGAGSGGEAACLADPDSCETCLLTHCDEFACDCYDDEECAGSLECGSPCGGDDAVCDNCVVNNASGATQSALLRHCAVNECASDCGDLGLALGPCELCQAEECAPQLDNCIGNFQCYKLLTCLASCAEVGCPTDCQNAWPGGQTDLNAVQQCRKNNCDAACPDIGGA